MMFDNIRLFLNKVVHTMSSFFGGTTAKNEFQSVVSDEMSNAIDIWMNLYKGKAPWLTKNKKSLNLPAAIASEIARLVTLEMKVEIKAPAGTNSEKPNNSSTRADYLNEQLQPLLANIRTYCEYACAGGGLILKPYVTSDKKIAIDCVQATDFLPISFDSRGRITVCKYVEHKKQGDRWFHRVENHEYNNNEIVITNEAYKSYNRYELGVKVGLKEVPEWSNLQEKQTIGNVSKNLFGYFKIPLGNTIDPSSPLGVSVYSRAIGDIQDADEQYQRFVWEFEGGELAIDAAQNVFPTDKKGKPIMPVGRERLFRPNNLDNASTNELLKVFSPTLRDASIKNGLNLNLQQIEFKCGLAYGTISDPQVVEKTAEEIKNSKQRSYSTVSDIQGALQTALIDVIDAMDVYATLYNLVEDGKYEVCFVWDDSIVVNVENEKASDRNDVRLGLMTKWEYRVKWYGEDKETAKSVLAAEEAEKAKAQNPFNLS